VQILTLDLFNAADKSLLRTIICDFGSISQFCSPNIAFHRLCFVGDPHWLPASPALHSVPLAPCFPPSRTNYCRAALRAPDLRGSVRLPVPTSPHERAPDLVAQPRHFHLDGADGDWHHRVCADEPADPGVGAPLVHHPRGRDNGGTSSFTFILSRLHLHAPGGRRGPPCAAPTVPKPVSCGGDDPHNGIAG